MTFLEQYQRHFCYHCQQYAPEGYGAKGEKKCPICGSILSYVAQYDRFYCYRCNTYPPIEPEPAPVTVTAPEKPPEETPAAMTPEQAATAPAAALTVAPAAVAGALAAIPPTPKPKEEGPAEVKVVEARATVAKPPLVREEIIEARKPVLMDFCKAYDLDPSGTKEQLRERLLSYLDELEGEERSEEPEPAPTPEPEPQAQAEPEELPQEPAPEVKVEPAPKESVAEQAQVAAVVIQEEKPAEPKVEIVPQVVQEPAPRLAIVAETRPVAQTTVQPTPAPPVKVEHPCPTCGRELEYISQYDRWYCYSCRRYASAIVPKNACPSCGATLRWIEKYSRWWCDSCHQYAPADLPAPRGTVAVAEAARPAFREEAKAEVAAHHHRSPSTGISLAGLGLVMWVLYEILVEVPRFFPVDFGITLQREYAFLLQFFGLLFVALGVIVGIAALKHRA